MPQPNQSEPVSSVLKVFTILQALGERGAIGVSELAQSLMMSKATTYRFLQTMKSLGYVDQIGESDKYSLTLKLFELGSTALEQVDLIALADQEMRLIAEKTNEAVHLGVMDKDAIVYVHKIDSGYNLRMYSRVGKRNPLYCTAIGKVLLSGRSDSWVTERMASVDFIQFTEQTLANTEQLLQELALVRQQYFAQDNEEQEMGIRCLAVPIFDRFGHIVASMSMSFPTIRFRDERLHEFIHLLHQASKMVSLKMGWADYPNVPASTSTNS